MSEHTKEPWQCWFCRQIADVNGNIIVTTVVDDVDAIAFPRHIAKKNLHRIVACVNACAGIPTEELEAGIVQDMRDDLLGWAAFAHEVGPDIRELHEDAAGETVEILDRLEAKP